MPASAVLASAVLASAVLVGACRSEPGAPTSASASTTASAWPAGSGRGASAAPAAASGPPALPWCREGTARQDSTVLLGEAPVEDPDAEADDPLGLPFAVSLGNATPLAGGGFAVAASLEQAGATQAVVALVAAGRIGAVGQGAASAPRGEGSAHLVSGASVELGRTHGAVDPPRLAARDGRLVAAVQDGDANGTLVRLAKLSPGPTGYEVTWGALVPQGRDESQTFGVELGGEGRGLLVWDEWSRSERRSMIQALTFDSEHPVEVGKPVRVSPLEDECEAPAIVARPGGFWLAWLASAPVAAPRAARASKRGAAAPTSVAASEPSDEPPRWLAVVPLDAQGAVGGAPVRVGAESGHAQSFDLATAPDGAALLLWRDAATAPEGSGGAVHLGRVAVDGSVTTSPVSTGGEPGEGVGVGTPLLLVDAAGRSESVLGLVAVYDEADRPRLGALRSAPRAEEVLHEEPALLATTPLALHAGRLLVSRARGRAVQLSVLECSLPK